MQIISGRFFEMYAGLFLVEAKMKITKDQKGGRGGISRQSARAPQTASKIIKL